MHLTAIVQILEELEAIGRREFNEHMWPYWSMMAEETCPERPFDRRLLLGHTT
jgi:hypothetical protein